MLLLAATATAQAGPKVLVIGIDGIDPVMLQEYRDQGLLPNFDRFIAGGAQFQPLGTTIPPQSPVAWSTFTTGTDPGGHGIFDFIHRDPATMLPYLSTSSAQAPGAHWQVGRWQIPRGGGAIENLRQGTAFWQVLDAGRRRRDGLQGAGQLPAGRVRGAHPVGHGHARTSWAPTASSAT